MRWKAYRPQGKAILEGWIFGLRSEGVGPGFQSLLDFEHTHQPRDCIRWNIVRSAYERKPRVYVQFKSKDDMMLFKLSAQ